MYSSGILKFPEDVVNLRARKWQRFSSRVILGKWSTLSWRVETGTSFLWYHLVSPKTTFLNEWKATFYPEQKWQNMELPTCNFGARFVNIDQASLSGLGKRFERYDEVRSIPSLLSAANDYRCSIWIHWRCLVSPTPNRISLFFCQSVSLCCSLV